MLSQQPYLVIAILVLALVLFIWERWRYDIVALGIMFLLVITGQIDPTVALYGFGHPAVMTVLFALIISRGLRNSGVVNLLSQKLKPYMTTPTLHVLTITATVTFISAFINNVGAIAIMLPVALASAQKMNRSPTFLLMPMAFGSLVGGMMTLIGTPPNIIIAEYHRQNYVDENLSMFDFSFVGAPIAIVAVIVLALIGWRIMPVKRRRAGGTSAAISDYIMEIRATEDCKMLGQRLIDLSTKYQDEISVVGLMRGKDKYIHPADWRKIGKGDLLIVKTDPTLIQTIAAEQNFSIVSQRSNALKNIKLSEMRLAEAVITSSSLLIDRSYAQFKKKTNNLVTLMAVSRETRDIRTRLRDVTFQEGDVLLMQGEDNSLDEHLSELGLLPLAERDLTMIQTHKAFLSVVVFSLGILLNVFLHVPIAFALLSVVLAYVVLDLIPSRDVYRDVDWSVIILLGSMFSLGIALDETGASYMIANSLLTLLGDQNTLITIVALMAFTMMLTNIINNAATALLMAPIAVEIANQLNANPNMFLMTVCVGASSAFMTPIGHQSNTLVMSAAGYKFSDFWKLGLVMQITVLTVGTPLLYYFWSGY